MWKYFLFLIYLSLHDVLLSSACVILAFRGKFSILRAEADPARGLLFKITLCLCESKMPMSSTSRDHSSFEAMFCFTFGCVTALRLEYEFVTLWFSRFKMLLDKKKPKNQKITVLLFCFPLFVRDASPALTVLHIGITWHFKPFSLSVCLCLSLCVSHLPTPPHTTPLSSLWASQSGTLSCHPHPLSLPPPPSLLECLVFKPNNAATTPLGWLFKPCCKKLLSLI